MSATDGEELGPLLDEQRAYDRALAADYLDQGLEFPGGDEVTQALDAFQPVAEIPLVPLGMLVSIHDRDRSEVVSRSPRCLADVSA